MAGAGKDLDLTFLYDIADGSDEFIVETITMFLQQSPEILQEVETAIDAKNWPVAASAAHKIKANLGFFGMLVSQALIQDVEAQCKAGTPVPAELMSKFRQAKSIIGESLVELAQIKAKKEANL
jgi:HPt (histidine-containing phosphotransfer) domain-containing protein